MNNSRRKFLQMTGAVAALSAMGPTVFASSEPAKHGGKRWGMAIDLKKFENNEKLAEKCIEACHLVHNVPNVPDPDPDTKGNEHEIKWIWKQDYEHAFIEKENHHLPEKYEKKKVLLLCNHCDNPPCTNVCPTKATWKREEDGIVMMDWHRCIGCRYCIAACPYGSRSFNFVEPRQYIDKYGSTFPTRTKGVVEKCTFCEERIAKGQQPACVEVCKNDELVFGDLNDPNSKIRKVLSNNYSIRRKPELGTQPEVYYLV